MDINHLGIFLYFILKQLPIWAAHEIVNQTMSGCFKASYHFDCTELFIEMASLFCAQLQIYQSYKSRNTARTLLVLLLVEL